MKELCTCLIAVVFFVASGPGAHGQEATRPSEFIDALNDQAIADEIEVVPSQIKAMKTLFVELADNRTKIIQKQQSDIRNAPASDRAKIEGIYDGQFREIQTSVAERMKETLLPFQVMRLEQLIRQRRRDRAEDPILGNLLSSENREYLNIGTEQADRIREKGQRLRDEVEREIKALITKARNEVVDELDPKQRDKYQELLGAPLSSTTKK